MDRDRDLAWWSHSLFAGWAQRPGPRYQRLAAAVLEAVDDGTLAPGARVPAERLLAAALGVSRGTVVAAVEQLVRAGVVRRRQGSGTTVVGRPGWTSRELAGGATSILLRQLADRAQVDLSLSVPAGADHLPPVELPSWSAALTGHGLDGAGLPELRERIAEHLSTRHGLPTDPGQLVVTSGAQQALSLLGDVMALRPATVVAGCPSYPGLLTAFAGRRIRVVGTPTGPAGADPEALARAARSAERPILYVTPVDNPTGTVMPTARRAAVLDAAGETGALVVEDMALADLVLEPGRPPAPLAAASPEVIAVGTVSKVFWAGLRVGWVRVPEAMRAPLLQAKVGRDLATSVPSQLLAARLLGALDDGWLGGLRATLAARRDQLARSLQARIPSWTLDAVPAAGLSLWLRLPVVDTEAFADTARRCGVTVAPGRALCACGRHHGYVRLSFAEPPDRLELAVERLALAWELHCEDMAAVPASG